MQSIKIWSFQSGLFLKEAQIAGAGALADITNESKYAQKPNGCYSYLEYYNPTQGWLRYVAKIWMIPLTD
jgi:hypothetical protein